MSFECKKCGKKLSSAGTLLYHLNKKNSCLIKYTCDKCNEEFNTKCGLKKHQNNCLKESSNNIDFGECCYNDILDNIPDIVIQYDKDYNIKYISRSCEKILGYKQEEMIGKSNKDFICKEDLIEKKEESEKKEDSEINIQQRLCKYGEKKKMIINTKFLYDCSKNIINIISTERSLKDEMLIICQDLN